MSSDSDGPDARQRQPGGARGEASAVARNLLRQAWKASLSTVAREGGHPYASLVAVACAPSGAPLLLLSGLAEHTKNLAVDRRASLLLDGTSPGRAALTGPRVTLVGQITDAAGGVGRRRYLARHPAAAGFIDFGDFGLYTLEVEWAHLVAGFGRIVRLAPADVLTPVEDATELIVAEESILQHMNDDHSDAVALMAARALGSQPSESSGQPHGWTMIGSDPDGCDLTDGEHAVRVEFPQRVTTPDEVRGALVELVRAARALS